MTTDICSRGTISVIFTAFRSKVKPIFFLASTFECVQKQRNTKEKECCRQHVSDKKKYPGNHFPWTLNTWVSTLTPESHSKHRNMKDTCKQDKLFGFRTLFPYFSQWKTVCSSVAIDQMLHNIWQFNSTSITNQVLFFFTKVKSEDKQIVLSRVAERFLLAKDHTRKMKQFSLIHDEIFSFHRKRKRRYVLGPKRFHIKNKEWQIRAWHVPVPWNDRGRTMVE